MSSAVQYPTPPVHEITGLVLAGGRGTRMGGVDKGLQPFRGEPLVAHALRRLAPQTTALMISANRSLPAYRGYGVPVHADALPDYPGPLAGLLSGLQHCRTPYLVSVPCDTPLFPLDLVARLADALGHAGADIAVARSGDRLQPVFCLLKTTLAGSLMRYLASGERRIAYWTAQHARVEVPFDPPSAFFNANTLEELQELERVHE
ncbi:molybdenum cofactor guanylyltransferase MobA [Caldimonas brevitalea]|uniref:Molybdenum cofactor guanylyltransferase n=1 Tax=Caldimonas brevitalea TaxID=413882 RepID=A0A0G3BLT2_9BURK|nr:molybdenum cofactor guanylyltransferase MobA [Caldimonas brevitalea]AKJ28953.1 molybdopterin-guanine dinucleotide biosynthesis protein A [Caldimonas brevitalea]